MIESSKTVNCLSHVRPGDFVCVRLDAGGENAVRLKRLGICESRPLELVFAGDPMVIRVCGSNVGLSRQLAELVFVEPLSLSSCDPEKSDPRDRAEP